MMQSNHIQYIIDNYSIQLLAGLKKEEREITVEQAIDTLLACDPSQGKKLVDWLVKTYCSGGFRWEDVEIGAESKLAKVLEIYQTYSNQIPRDQRNIYIYRSYGELYTFLKPYIPEEKIESTPGSREIRRRERARALEESEVLYRSEDMIVSVPLTENAAQWWGRGTQWCTASDKNNYFNYYNQKAPLIVITLLNPCSDQNSSLRNNYSLGRGSVEKLQFWTDGGFNMQFMDAQDCEVDSSLIMQNWKYFEPLFTQLIALNGDVIYYLHPSIITTELCWQAVEQNATALGWVPKELRSAELCWLAVGKDGNSLISVPEPLKTNDLCTRAVEQSGFALHYVPQEFKTMELYEKAVERSGRALKYVPFNLRTLELCMLSVEQDGEALQYVPIEYQTTALHRKLISRDATLIYYVPEELRTFELCCLAIEHNVSALSCVPQYYKTFDLCRKAVEKNGALLLYVPVKHRTLELCGIAVDQDGLAIGDVPREILSTDLCIRAVQQNKRALHLIHDPFRTAEILDIYQKIPDAHKAITKQWDKSLLDRIKQALNKDYNSLETLSNLNALNPG